MSSITSLNAEISNGITSIAPQKPPAPSAPGRSSVVFTACSVNYIGKATAMCRSMLDHQPGTDAVILVVDTRRPVKMLDSRIRLWWVEDIGFPDFLKCAFKYNIIELNTSVKPFAALELLKTYSKVIYLDPDVCVFSPLLGVLSALETACAVFTPHALTPYEGSGRPTDQDLLRFGAFNLGFFAVNGSEQSKALLTWWHRQCQRQCFYEPQVGLGVDQKWIDLAPSFFEGVAILRDPGLNVAFWNLHERHLSRVGNRWTVNGQFPLVFLHFSSFSESDRSAIADKQTRYANGSRDDFAAVADDYREYLRTSSTLVVSTDMAYGFAAFNDGAAIPPALRRFYAICDETNVSACANPFGATSEVRRFAERHHLLSRGSTTITHANFKTVERHQSAQKAITIIFRILLRLLGPDRYFALTRFLAYYSSILNQTDIIRRN